MAALETRLLLLGAVSLFEPINGYQLRRELMTWHIDEWANIAPGSIYNGLRTLAKRGELVRHEIRDGARDVAVYETSEEGRAEFARLFDTAMTTVAPTMPIALHTALALLPMVARETARRLLAERLERLDAMRRQHASEAPPAGQSPPHVAALAEFWERLGEVEYEWLTRLAFRIGDGEFEFVGDERGWSPPTGDPGWQIMVDRQRYLAQLGRA